MSDTSAGADPSNSNNALLALSHGHTVRPFCENLGSGFSAASGKCKRELCLVLTSEFILVWMTLGLQLVYLGRWFLRRRSFEDDKDERGVKDGR